VFVVTNSELTDLHGAFEVDARFSLGGENVSGNS
jgi:hypothetical protein